MNPPMNPADDLPEEPPTPIPLTHRYVVPADGRRRLTWASVRFTLLSSRGQRWFYVAIVVFVLVVQTLEGWDPLDRALRDAAELLAVSATLAVLWPMTAGFSQTYRSTEDRFFPGAVLESGFGDDALVLRVPTGDTWLPYVGLRRVRARGDFVFLSLDGIGGQAIFPRALFPDHEIDRIDAARTSR